VKMTKPSILWMWIWKIYQSHEWMNEWKWKSIHPLNGWMKMEKHPSKWMDEWKWKTIHPINQWKWQNHE
jgi:hypothetical protein